MLVISKIVCEREEIDFYSFRISDKISPKLNPISVVFNIHKDSGIYFDVFDSNNGETYKSLNPVELYKLCNRDIKSVLGILIIKNDILFITVDIVTWKLLDYIDEVKQIGVEETPRRYLSSKYKFIKREKIDAVEVFSYNNNNKVVYFCYLQYSLIKLDNYGIFWLVHGNTYVTLYDIYKLMYRLCMTNCESIYVAGNYSKELFKLELNKDIIRLMTKSKVLGDKLCWQ